MVRGRELAHVDADLGDHDLSRRLAEAGDRLQPLDGIAKRAERAFDPRIELAPCGFDLLDRLQVLADQKAMVIADVAGQSRNQGLAGGGKP